MPSWNEIPIPEGSAHLRIQIHPDTLAPFRVLVARPGYSVTAAIRVAITMLAEKGSVTMDEIIPELDRLREKARAGGGGHPNSSRARTSREGKVEVEEEPKISPGKKTRAKKDG